MALACAALPAAAPAQSAEPPAAQALWTIRSPDCVSVHADGEPWDECGFQAFDMNGDGSRILTVSATGVTQIWDGDGRELRRIEWADDRSGATGYPTARIEIIGQIGVVVVHQNQLMLIDLTDGRILRQHVADLMMFNELRVVGPDRIFADIRENDWAMGVREIALPGGELSTPRDVTDLMRVGRGYWVTGARAPFTIHFADPARPPIQSERSCMPLNADFCVWREIGGRVLHVFDIRAGSWRSHDTGRSLDQFTGVQFVPAGAGLYAIICDRAPSAYPAIRACALNDLATGAVLYRFEASNQSAVGGVDAQGRPEIRLSLNFDGGRRETRIVGLDGTARTIESVPAANISPPGGGMILPTGNGGTSLLVNAAGREIARLPFAPLACGNGWPTWSGWCRYSADSRRWLVPFDALSGSDTQNHDSGLTLYAVPDGTP